MVYGKLRRIIQETVMRTVLFALNSVSFDLHVSRQSRASRQRRHEIEPLRQIFIALKNASCDIQISRNSRVDGLRGRLVRKVNVHVACLEKR